MQSKATTVEQYLAGLPEDRRQAIQAVREVVLKSLDKDYEEGMQYGMIGYYVPHRVFPAGYHCDPRQPLPFAGLASQKNYMSLYLMCLYGDGSTETRFREAWAKTGRKLDMGKCCIRFKRLDDLALDVLADAIRRVPVKTYLERYQAILASTGRASGKKPGSSGAAKSGRTAKPRARATGAAKSRTSAAKRAKAK
ncbi:MAG: DUF1801 domain-containing protein [Planctomycetes bacterium]|nr:DUF1801 domain-containing protein [Planctomycetota bacterium]